jgi:hypothetical protein
MSVSKSEVFEDGMSRRQWLLGIGTVTAGYTVGQMASGASVAFGAYPDALLPAEVMGACEWPTTAGWVAAFGSLEEAAREAATRAYERYKAGGG